MYGLVGGLGPGLLLSPKSSIVQIPMHDRHRGWLKKLATTELSLNHVETR